MFHRRLTETYKKRFLFFIGVSRLNKKKTNKDGHALGGAGAPMAAATIEDMKRNMRDNQDDEDTFVLTARELA